MKWTIHETMVSAARARLAAMLVTVALGLCGVAGAPLPAWADAPAPSPSAANFEERFLEDMIDHHAMAVETGMICLEEAEHEELAALCEGIVTSQAAEIDTMQAWLLDWYGVAYAPQMHPKGEKVIEDLEELEGAAFEIEFLEMMIKHHRQAVREGVKCLRKAYHEEQIELCGGIVAVQAAEIALMESWLCDWYGICHGA